MKTMSLITIIGMALFISACTDTFLVYKDGYGYFMGSGSKAKYDLICTSGDLEKVLLSSHLNQETKDSLFKYSCSAERSGNKVKQIYASMTVEERKDIKSAFRKNGYMINYMNC